MTQSSSDQLVIPEPSRLLEGLRDTGYDFNTAVCDIIDNSIAAEATQVRIIAYNSFDDGIHLSIADNGIGMDRDGLVQAMRYGAPERKEAHSLGKFGLGLKTASTSCCRRLKVISRDSASAELNCAVWDLDYIAHTGNWYLKFESPTFDDIEELEVCAEGSSGTIVVWEKCDRLLSARYSNPQTKAFNAAFDRSLVVLRQHVAMVYQRFLDFGDDRARNVEIYINNEKVDPWDPFCKEFGKGYGEKEYVVKVRDIDGSELSRIVTVTPYIVPAKQELQTDEEKHRVMPSYGNSDLKSFSEESLSGFYVYRENRLIHWGDWFNMPGIDFHHKLCRFELSFSQDLDDVFQVDIKKSRILLNEDMREKLFKLAAPIKSEGNLRYRGQSRKAAVKVSKGMHEDSNAQLEKTQETAKSKNKIEVDDEGKPSVTNRFGTTPVPYEVYDASVEHPVKVEDSLVDGLLWMPAVIDGKNGVQLNSNHPFYQRFYALSKKNTNVVYGMDSVFLAFSQAEATAWESEAQENLEEARYEASRLLRKYAEGLPDVSIEDISDEEE